MGRQMERNPAASEYQNLRGEYLQQGDAVPEQDG